MDTHFFKPNSFDLRVSSISSDITFGLSTEPNRNPRSASVCNVIATYLRPIVSSCSKRKEPGSTRLQGVRGMLSGREKDESVPLSSKVFNVQKRHCRFGQNQCLQLSNIQPWIVRVPSAAACIELLILTDSCIFGSSCSKACIVNISRLAVSRACRLER